MGIDRMEIRLEIVHDFKGSSRRLFAENFFLGSKNIFGIPRKYFDQKLKIFYYFR